MADLSTALKTARSNAGLSLRDLARIAQIAPSGVSRAENGAELTVSTFRRLIDAADLDNDLKPRSRPQATYAARILLGDGDDVSQPEDMGYWVDRWTRLRLLNGNGVVLDARGLALRAGVSGYLSKRPMSARLPRTGSASQLARTLGEAGVAYAVTGAAGANRLISYADEPWPVLYVEDLRTATEALGVIPKMQGEYGPATTLIAFDGSNNAGAWQSQPSGLWYAAPWQIVLDCYGGVDRMINQADWILDSWEGPDGEQ